jgi:hypothetical protein
MIDISILAVFVVDDLIYVYLAIAAASAAYSYSAAQESAKAQEQAGLYQKQAADQQARNVELTNAENIRRERTNKKRRLARIRTGMANSGLVMEGSIEDAFVETAGVMELEIQDAARAGQMDAANLRSAGNLSLWESRVGALATRTEATGSLLSSAASMTGTAYNSGALKAK